MNPIYPASYPFLYAPVVEYALSLPTYTLFDKGYDRYPLRKSVSDRFRTERVWRRDKSQTTGIFQLGMKKNLDYILSLCAKGHFVQRELIEKEELEKTISLISHGDTNDLWPFTHLASAEIFLSYWDKS